MIALIRFLLSILALPLKSRRRLQAENAVLRQQVIVLRRKAKGHSQLTNADRWFFVQLYRWFPSILDALTIICPETLLVGIVRASANTDAGSQNEEQGDRRSRRGCAP